MATTKINYNQIKGATINAFDYMTAAQIADVTSYTGSVDVTAALNLAFANTTRIVYCPAGSYRCSSALAAPTCLGIIGDGWEEGNATRGTLFGMNGAVGFDIRGTDWSGPLILRDFYVGGTSIANGVGILIGNSGSSANNYAWTDGEMSNVRITGFSGTNAIGLFHRDSNFCNFYDVRIDNCTAWYWSSSCADTVAFGNTNTPADCHFYNLQMSSQLGTTSRAIEIATGSMNFTNTKVNLCQSIMAFIAPGSTGACPAHGVYSAPPPAATIQLTFNGFGAESCGATGGVNSAKFYISGQTAQGAAYVVLRDMNPEIDTTLAYVVGPAANLFIDNIFATDIVSQIVAAGGTAADFIQAVDSGVVTVANWSSTVPEIDALSLVTKQSTSGLVTGPALKKTFTITSTGHAAVTGNASYYLNTKTVTLLIPQITGTSNSVTFTLTGLPTEISPTTAQQTLCNVQDNSGTFVPGLMVVNGSVITLYSTLSAGGWTASGTKTLISQTITYLLP